MTDTDSSEFRYQKPECRNTDGTSQKPRGRDQEAWSRELPVTSLQVAVGGFAEGEIKRSGRV